MKLPLRGRVATRKLHAFAGVGALCFKVWLPAPRRGFPRKLCWVQILQMAYADYFIQGEINRRVLDAARIPGVGAHTKWATHSARGACCTTKRAVVGWPIYLRSASQSRLVTRQSGPSAVSIPISPPGLGHLLVSFSFGILSPWPIISFTGGTRRKAAPN